MTHGGGFHTVSGAKERRGNYCIKNFLFIKNIFLIKFLKHSCLYVNPENFFQFSAHFADGYVFSRAVENPRH